jgi:hypothetical protein
VLNGVDQHLTTHIWNAPDRDASVQLAVSLVSMLYRALAGGEQSGSV